MKVLRAAKQLLRGVFVIQFALGMLLWTTNAAVTSIHLILGFLFVLTLWYIAATTYAKGAQRYLAALTVLWGVLMIVVGIKQTAWITGSEHWVIDVVHICIGVLALGFAEMLVASIKHATPPIPEREI